MKTFKQYLEEKLATIPTVGALGALGATVAGMYSTSQPNQEKEPEVTQKPFSTPTAQFTTLQPSPDEGKQPTVLNDNKEDAAQKNLKVQQLMMNHIKSTEGFRNKAYKDTGGVWTIGYGSTYHYDKDGNITSKVKQGDKIDEPTALQYISHHINTQVDPRLEEHLPSIFDMKQNSDVPPELIARFKTFAYNVGTDALTNSKRTSVAQPLIAAHKEKDPEKRKELLLTGLKGTYDFHKDNGVPIPGLLNRRHEKVISVLSALKDSGYLSDEEHEMHSNHAREIHRNYMNKYGWE
jgi:GH24 family phage-related lysozyme (muramidase)